ncbi:hypothetical protein QBC38DRAFT_389832 [Podospora fimiseda]|uniref:RING-CH-type domain-containing protein n=1 Tax=Podospora fimiseda TaxID=252190 RepID=A0AAN7BR79_9PEZI|nr:hypothetical protein QBC38DRAFT_389832 [Podospora fimiseda]
MNSTAPQWSWPSDMDSQTGDYGDAQSRRRGGRARNEENRPEPTPPRQRHYKPRKCRICLEEVYPTTEIDDSFAGRLFSTPRVRYVSDDPDLGRLMSPCMCKGSQKYVHEGCLQAWRHAMYMDVRHYYRCPTCLFEYHLERLRWSHWLKSKAMRATLTFLVMVATIFVLGFFGEIFIRWIREAPGLIYDEYYLEDEAAPVEIPGFEGVSPDGWIYHFFKGFISLGVIGFLKGVISAPMFWHRFGGGRRRRRRENTLEWYSYAVIVLGVFTFMFATWRFVGTITSRYLEKASDRVMDVQRDNGPDEDDEDE